VQSIEWVWENELGKLEDEAWCRGWYARWSVQSTIAGRELVEISRYNLNAFCVIIHNVRAALFGCLHAALAAI
jgi:hypothetical protein